MIYELQREQQLNCTIETAWDFFSSAHNLAEITPKNMNFVVINTLEVGPIYKDMIIDYKVSPLLRIPMRWRTKIIQVEPYVSFTDYQEKGPYKLWHHFHEFIPNEKGVLMKDTVRYELPFGFIGTVAHMLFIRKKLTTIFSYRYEILDKMFNTNEQ